MAYSWPIHGFSMAIISEQALAMSSSDPQRSGAGPPSGFRCCCYVSPHDVHDVRPLLVDDFMPR